MAVLADDENGTFEELDRAECLELLAGESVGRIATCVDGQAPEVVPVNFILDGEFIVFRSAPRRAVELRSRPASFEVDRFDPSRKLGWSVLVRGWLAPNSGDPETEVSVWAPGDRPVLLQLEPEKITGRRISPAPYYISDVGYL